MIKHPLLVPVVMTCNDEFWLSYCLEASRGKFSRYTLYDVGSTDRTKEIIEWFINSSPNVEFFVRLFDTILHPQIQGMARNAMISESRSEFYFILDADEIYTPESFDAILEGTEQMHSQYRNEKIYGVVPRIEVTKNLNEAYGLDRKVSHHRIYNRTAIFKGPHPGEVPFYKQKESNEYWISNAKCWHLHNTERSRYDAKVPKRLERRMKKTYHPGFSQPINLLEELPILRKPIHNFEPNPELKKKQELWHALETGAYV